MKNRNQETADRLDDMNLSRRARDVIATTDFNSLFEIFGNMTAEEVEEFCREVAE